MEKRYLEANWIPLRSVEQTAMRNLEGQIHQASHFVGLAGKHFLENLPDYSMTNMEWLPSLRVLAGKWLDGNRTVRVAVSPDPFQIQFLDMDFQVIASLDLPGQTRAVVMDWMRNQFGLLGLGMMKYQWELDGEVPPHEINDGAAFQSLDPGLAKAFSDRRFNGHLACGFFQQFFLKAAPVRTWPHHLDAGCYISVRKDTINKISKTIAMGMAISDTVMDESYYYVGAWGEGFTPDFGLVDPLPAGKWLIGDYPYQGAVLPHSRIAEESEPAVQIHLVHNFLKNALNGCLMALREPMMVLE